MEPTKDETHAIVEFVDVLLREGVVVQADIIVTVADIPLVGINLRAAIAGMTTMTDYGIFEDWDAAHRHQQRDDGLVSSTADHRENTFR